MKNVISLLTILSLLGISFPNLALAQAKKKATKRVKVGKTVYDFDEVDILGRLKRPDGREVFVSPEFRFRRLLNLDESFLPNIVKAVDEF